MSPISVSSASLVLRRVVILATVGRETVVFCLLPSFGRTYPVFLNMSQHRRDVISLTILFVLRSPWKGPVEFCLNFVLTFLLLYAEGTGENYVPFFWFSAWAANCSTFDFSLFLPRTGFCFCFLIPRTRIL